MLAFRRVTILDRDRLFAWRNDPETIRASFSQSPVQWDEHCAWLERSLQSSDRILYIAELDKVPVATARFDICEECAEISVTVAPSFRGRGLGSEAISGACLQFFATVGIKPVVARIKPENDRSLRAFRSAGFCEIKRDNDIVTMLRT